MVFENVKKMIHIFLLREIYGMLVVTLLLNKKFCGDLRNIGFEFNNYDTCVANRINMASNTQ